MSEKLEKARLYEIEEAKNIPQEEKPAFHVSAPVGWINDPNGFSVFKGKVHLFYQYHPYSRDWGPMHWGHSVTEDMIRWEQLPAALAPDQEYDREGCFSGSAIEADGKQALIYTGVTTEKLPDGKEEVRQNQCIAWGDGKDYVKAEKNPVVTGDMLPEKCSRVDFRDPKIWEDNGTYHMLVGCRSEEIPGQVVLFSSKDLKEWKFETILAENKTGEIGVMWECPDFFSLGEKHVLICSPQHMRAKGYEFHNGHNSLYFTGDYDSEKHTFEKDAPVSLDYGLDFYAPQTTLLPDGRRVMIAWMRMPKPVESKDGTQWTGMMCLPRVVGIKNGQVTFEVHPNVKENFEEIDLTKVVLKLKEKQPLWITTTLSEGEELEIGGYEICLEDGKVVGNRERVFADMEGYHVENQTPKVGKSAKLDIFVEENLIEIFVNDGQYVLSHVVYGLGDTLNGKIQKVRVLK